MTEPDSTPGVDGKCGAFRNGKHCTQAAGWGTSHPGIGRCKLHGGSTPTHQRAASMEIARRECERLGVPIEVDAGEALVSQLWESYGNVAFYRELVQDLPTHPAPDLFVEGEDGSKGHWERGDPGIYGRTYHVSGTPTGEAKPHILLQLYNEERDRCGNLAAAALRAGVDERRVRLIEQDASRILAAQVMALRAIGMGDRLEDFRRAFVSALRPAVEQPLALGAADSG